MVSGGRQTPQESATSDRWSENTGMVTSGEAQIMKESGF